MDSSKSHSNSEFYGQIKQDTAIYSNIVFILDKIEGENHLNELTKVLQKIMNKEISYANNQLQILKSNYNNFDLNSQLIQNTLIFKENFKLITGSLSNLIS